MKSYKVYDFQEPLKDVTLRYMRLWLSATFIKDLVDRKVTLCCLTCQLLTNMCPDFTLDFLLYIAVFTRNSQYSLFDAVRVT